MSQHSRAASSIGRGDVSMSDVRETTDDHPENDIGRWLDEIVAPSLDHSVGLSAKRLLDQARRSLIYGNIALQEQGFYEEDWLAFQRHMMRLLEELDVKQLICDTGLPPTWLKAMISMDHFTGAIQAINAKDAVKKVLKRPEAERPQTMTDFAINVRQEDKYPRRQAYITPRQAVLEDFKKEYIGTAVDSLHQLLRHAIQKNQTQKKLYAPVMAIVQSSGTGKSRTAVELTKHVLGLYVCVRPPGSGNINSAPPQDISVYRYLKPESDETSEESALAVAFWLKAYCVEFRRYCLAKREKAENQLSHKEFVGLVSSSLMEGLLPDVDRGTRDGTSSERTRLLDAISSKATEFAEAFRNTNPASPPVILETKLLVEMVKPDFRLLEKIVGQDDLIFLAFDEAISLGPQRLTALRRLLNHLKLKKFWVLILDTNNRVSELAGRAAVEPSLRLLNRELYLAPPFVALPHDLFLYTEQGATRYNKILSGEISVTHKELIALLPKMGRPLWDDSFLKNEDTEQFAIAGVSMRTIYEKLIGETMDITPKEMTDAQTMATVCQRVPLQLIGAQGLTHEQRFLEKQIAQHLRTVVAIQTDGPLLRSCTPSEPLLSLSVANAYRINPAASWSAAIKCIVSLAGRSELLHGENGEEFVRIVASFAMDLALRVPRPCPPVSTNHECPPHLFVVRLDVWLEKLFGQNLLLSKGAVTWTKTRWLNFTHFARVGAKFTPDKPVPLSMLAQAWTRGVAISGVSDQQDTDTIFVALYSKNRPELTDIVDLKNISVIFLQIKNFESQYPLTRHESAANQGPSLPPGISSLNIQVSTDARDLKIEAKTLQEEPSKHAIYIEGPGPETFPLIDKLDNEVRELLPDILGRWKHNEGISHTPRMTDFLNGYMHLEGFPKFKGIPLGKVRQADDPEPATSSAVLGSTRAKKQKTRKHK